MKLARIKLKEYLQLEDSDEYNFAIKFSGFFNEPIDSMGIGDVYQLKFGLVKDIQQDLADGNVNLEKQIEYLVRIKEGLDIYNCYLDEVTKTSSYLIEKIIELTEIEGEMLSSNSYNDENGLEEYYDKLAKLGVILQIRSLANNDVTKFEDIRNTNYQTCFLELYTRNIESEIHKKQLKKQK